MKDFVKTFYKKNMERVILGWPGKTDHVQQCPLLPLDTSPTEVATAPASHCCSSPTGFSHLILSHTAKHRNFHSRSFLSSFSPSISLLSGIQPLVYLPMESSTHWPTPGPCSGLSPTTWEVRDAGANNKQHRKQCWGHLLAKVFNS